jgi:hypothetical protein
VGLGCAIRADFAGKLATPVCWQKISSSSTNAIQKTILPLSPKTDKKKYLCPLYLMINVAR